VFAELCFYFISAHLNEIILFVDVCDVCADVDVDVDVVRHVEAHHRVHKYDFVFVIEFVLYLN